MSRCARVLSRRRFSNSPRSILRISPGFPVPALDTTRPMSRSLVASASLSRKPSCDRSATTVRYCTLKSFARPCPTSSSKLSRRATSTTLSPEAASCRANSLPIPDEAPVTSAHGPNLFLSSATLIFLLRPACLRSPYAHRGGEYRQNSKCHSSDHLVLS